MRKLLVKTLFSVLVGILLCIVSMYIWSVSPVKIDRRAADPAVTYLNSLSDGNPYKSGFHQFGDHTLHYVEAGKGDTILFLHGFPSYWFSFSKQMENLHSDYRVIAIDGLGAGRSDVPKSVDAYKLEQMSKHMVALMDELGVNAFHLVGHDWGSAFAFSIAQHYPNRVKSVTGIAAPPANVLLNRLETDPSIQAQFSYMEQFKTANPFLIIALGAYKRIWTNTFKPLVLAGHLSETEGQLFRNATNNPKRINALINWYRANIPAPSEISRQDYWPPKETPITAPALVIWGQNDPVFASSFVEDTKALSDNLNTLILDDVNHRPHVERSEQVSQAIKTLIENNHLVPQ